MKKTNNVLGISIGTRYVGIAAIQNEKLVAHTIKVFRGKWSLEKQDAIIKKLRHYIHYYRSNAIAVKAPIDTYHSCALRNLINALKKEWKKQRLQVAFYTIDDLKKHCGDLKNKRALIKCIGLKYPKLMYLYKKEHQNRNTHYTKMFEAIVATELLHSLISLSC